jgi:CxxC motif-containing protein (DUF1111 family)
MTLAPVSRSHVDDNTRAGERIFSAIGCAACHIPRLTTGPSGHPAFNRRSVDLFSDLLLHDVGTGDGIQQGAAEPGEIRTPALWGLRFRRPFLHDGRATTIADAIERHAGEAELVRRGFQRLTPDERMLLLAFLRSL